MLQFTQKQGRVKRKALLLTGTGGLDFESMKNEVPVDLPQPLPGDAFERMKADPELIAMKKRFAWSVSAVVVLVIAAAIVNMNRELIFGPEEKPIVQPVVTVPNEEVAPTVVRDTRIASAPRPNGKPEMLDFTQVKAREPTNLPPPRSQSPSPRVLPGGEKRIPVPGYTLPNNRSQGLTAPSTQLPSNPQNSVPSVPRSLLRIAKSRGAMLIDHDLQKAKSALVGFLKAPTSSERLRYVADRQVVEPRLRAFEARFGESPVAFLSISDSLAIGNGRVSEHDVVLADRRVHRASVFKSDDGSYLVDWSSFVGEGDLEWEDFMERRVSTPVLLRVTAEIGDVYGGDFADSKWFLCVKMHHPVRLGLPPLYAYVDRKSVIGREVEYWLKEGNGQLVPMSVRVRYPSVSPTANQVSLTEFVSQGWILRGGQAVADIRGR